MAKLIVQNTLNNTSDYPNTFVRTNAFPLERYSVFETIDGAKDYARNNPIAYIGQQLVVATSETETPSSFIISGGGELVRIPDVYDLTSASDSLTADLNAHTSTSATTGTFGHVKLSNNEVLANYGTIATNANGQLVSPIATASTYGVVKACSNTSQPEGSPQHVIGLDTNGCVVLNIAKTHSGFNIVGENALGSTGQQTILKVNTGTHPNSSTYHPTTNESSTVITNDNGQLAVYPASASHYGVVKIGTNLSNTDYSVVPNCSSVNAAITSLSGTVNNKFLPLSGGIVTGSLTIRGTNNYISQLDFGGSAAEAGLKVRGISGRLYDSPEKGSLFVNFDSIDISHEDYWTYDTNDGRGVFICGKGNDSLAVRKKDLIAYSSSVSSALSNAIETKISNEYLPLSGGTLTGNVGIGTTSPTEKLHVDGGIKSTALSSDSAKINNTLSIGPIDISNGIINGIKRLEFPDSIIIGTNIEDNSSNVIHIEANGNKVFDGNHGHASLIINGFGLTITHQLSSESGFETEPSKVTITANTLDKLNHIDTIVTSGSVNLIESGAVYGFIHGDTVSIGSTTNTPSGTIEIVAIENELQNKLAVSSSGLTLAHPVSSSNENDEVVYSQDEVTVTADDLKKLKNLDGLKSTMVVREWDYASTLPETTMTNNTMMIFRNWDLEQNHLDLIDKKLETI